MSLFRSTCILGLWLVGAAPVVGGAAGIGLVVAAPACAQPDETSVNRAAINGFLDLAYRQKRVREAYETYAARDLIQHNQSMADGREAAIDSISKLLADKDAAFEMQRVLVDGDLAAVHFKGRLNGSGTSAAVVEIFRLEHGRIVEHWDVFQIVPPPTPGHRPMF